MKIKGVNVHPSITDDRVLEACERHMHSLDSPGFCILCGVDADGVEPDARGIKCESCGANCVFGAEELLIRIAA